MWIFNSNRHRVKNHQDDCNLFFNCFFVSFRFVLARAIIFIPHVYVILFAKCVGVPHLNRDAQFKLRAPRHSCTHIIILYISQHNRIHKMIQFNVKFSVCMKLQTCIVHTIVLMGSKLNWILEFIALHFSCVCSSFFFFCLQISFERELRVLIARVPRNSCRFQAMMRRRVGGGKVVQIQAILKKNKQIKKRKQVDNIYMYLL